VLSGKDAPFVSLYNALPYRNLVLPTAFDMEEAKEFPQRVPSSAQGGNGADDSAKQEQMRRDMLTALLDSGARERCMF
jgi:hypothetical protein